MSLKEKTLSVSSLINLGILEIPWDGHFSDDSRYDGFKETSIYESAKKQYPDKQLKLDKRVIRPTSLGELFLSFCFREYIIEVSE